MNVKKILAKKESKMPLNNLCKKVIKKIVELDSEILGGTGLVMDYVEIDACAKEFFDDIREGQEQDKL